MLKNMYQKLEKYYLCGIGARGEIDDFRVGIYNEKRGSFSFSNGSYNATELYREPKGSNATYVVSAVSLQKLDDNELLINPHKENKYVRIPTI